MAMIGRRIAVDVIPGHSNFTLLEKGQKALSCKSVRQRVEHNVVNLLEPNYTIARSNKDIL